MTAPAVRPLSVTPDAVLMRAAAYLHRHGWTNRPLYDEHNGCPLRCPCHYTHRYPASMLGAIRAAFYGRVKWHLTADVIPAYTDAVEWLNSYLLAHGHAGQHAPALVWQAAPGRTPEQVMAALRAAATAYTHAHPTRRAAA
jgi:hypothetical protein